ncbi:MAG: hypothetical protein ACRETD_13555, partial [Steroidobacteraceae bacterium]
MADPKDKAAGLTSTERGAAHDNDSATENKLIAERRSKLAALRAASQQGGSVPFPNDFRRDALAAQLHAAFGERDSQWLEANPTRVRVGGRMLFKRVMG